MQVLNEVGQGPRGLAKSVQSRDDKRVTGPQSVKRPSQLRQDCGRAGDALINVDIVAPDAGRE